MALLTNKRAVITGAASGIGKATALTFASEGAKIVCLDIQRELLEENTTRISDSGGEATAIVCDITQRDEVNASIKEAADLLGGIDILCNIAGVGKMVMDIEENQHNWDRTIAVNLSGTFYSSQAALPWLLQERGAIVNCASTAAYGIPWAASYAAAKAGVCGLTRSMALSHGKQGLRVNCVAPGPTDTPIANDFMPPEGYDEALLHFCLPLGNELAQPAQIADAFVFLASSRASNINGVVLNVDGGARTH